MPVLCRAAGFVQLGAGRWVSTIGTSRSRSCREQQLGSAAVIPHAGLVWGDISSLPRELRGAVTEDPGLALNYAGPSRLPPPSPRPLWGREQAGSHLAEPRSPPELLSWDADGRRCPAGLPPADGVHRGFAGFPVCRAGGPSPAAVGCPWGGQALCSARAAPGAAQEQGEGAWRQGGAHEKVLPPGGVGSGLRGWGRAGPPQERGIGLGGPDPQLVREQISALPLL